MLVILLVLVHVQQLEDVHIMPSTFSNIYNIKKFIINAPGNFSGGSPTSICQGFGPTVNQDSFNKTLYGDGGILEYFCGLSVIELINVPIVSQFVQILILMLAKIFVRLGLKCLFIVVLGLQL